MPVLTDLIEDASVMSYSGLVDASTVDGQVDEQADWFGAVSALLDANVAQRPSLTESRRPRRHPLSARRRDRAGV